MEVLVKDLCNPDVVATIAKERFFFIKDKPNLTPETWEKFRGMIPSVHHTQPVDPNDLEARLRDCPPRLSEPPDLEDPWPEGYETPGPRPPEVIAESNKIGAEEAYDTLVHMGGRPTGPIRPIRPWKKVLVDGELCYRYVEQDETLFYDTWYGNRKADCNTSSTEAEFIAGHWADEIRRCREELRRWQDFRNTQQWRREHRAEFAREEDVERQRYPYDPQLTASLKQLKDWKEYQIYFQRMIDRCKQRIEGPRRMVEAIERKDPDVEKKIQKGHGHQYWLRTIEREREWLAAEEKRLEWVKQQLPAVLSECAASLTEAPTSRCEMVERSELEAKRVFNTLMDAGGRPSRPIRPVPDIQDGDTDKHLHVLCHWEGECSQFEEELREWKKFLGYRQKKEADGRTEVQLEEQQSAESPTEVDLWEDYRAYQQLEVDNVKQWVEFWQRQVEDCQETEDDAIREARETEKDSLRELCESSAYLSHFKGERMKSHVEEAQEQVGPAELRLEWVEQQLSALLAECAVTTTEVSTSDPLEDQAMPPKRASSSSQIMLKGLRSDRSSRSTMRNNQQSDKNKKHTSANSALGPIHSSRVSKAAGRKAPRPRRQPKILAKHGDGQNRGPNTTSPLLPANVAPRRSSRLSNKPQRSGALEAGLATNLGRSVQAQPTDVILRRSDRISYQKERTSTSTSSAAVNAMVILQTGLFPPPSRSQRKGRLAGIGLAKPRGVSKRQGRQREGKSKF